jgi:diguanylate cyclase (GGDEF)-like protein
LGIFFDAHLEKMAARITPADIVGEHALIGPDGGTTYVSAQWPARLVAIDAAQLRSVMEQVPRIALNALDVLSERLRASNMRHDPKDSGAGIDFMAHHDALTGLYNRRWMTSSYEAQIASSGRDESSLCLVLLDLDHFQRANEALGRTAADAILRQLADLIRNLLPSLDTLVRVSGDRFAFLWAAPLAETLAVCERLRAQVANRQFALRGGISTQMTVSIGVAQAMADLDATLEKAQASLARAKERGRNTVEPLLG